MGVAVSDCTLLSKSGQVLAPRTSVIVDGAARDVIPSWRPNADAVVAGLVAKYEADGKTVTTKTWVPQVLTQDEQNKAAKAAAARRMTGN